MAFVIRRARLSDKPEVLKVCANTWHRWDYVPLYFNRWVREKGFYVLLDGKRVIGLAKYTELAPGELWLEGLRIDPQVRSRGLGWKVSQRILKAALAEKPVSLRLTTGRRNTHSRRIIRKMGLRLKVALWGREGPVPRRSGKARVFVPSAQAAYDYIRKTAEFKTSKGLLQHTWQFHTITPELLGKLRRKGCLFGYGSNEDLQGVLILQPGRYESGRLDISFIEGSRKALPEFHRRIRQFARQHKAKSISGMATSKSVLRHLGGLRMRPSRRGMKRPWVMVYEYPLAGARN